MDKKEAEMKEDIAEMMRKKDYYDILGIGKTCDENEVKKAYRKLAMKYHPDKNSYEGAKEVFKKVSNAYTVLSNPQQRERYDRFGPEEEIQARQRQQQRQYYQQHQHGDQEFDEFDEIFRAFFGMNSMRMNHPNRARGTHFTYTFGGNNAGPRNGAQAGAQQKQGFGVWYLLVFMLVFYLVPSILKTKPYYSLNKSSEYQQKIQSRILKTDYFVRKEFFQEVNASSNFRQQIDFEADQQYLYVLQKTCEKSTRLQKKYEYQAYQYRPGEYRDYYLKEARKVDMSACRLIDSLYSQHPDYVSQIYRS